MLEPALQEAGWVWWGAEGYRGVLWVFFFVFLSRGAKWRCRAHAVSSTRSVEHLTVSEYGAGRCRHGTYRSPRLAKPPGMDPAGTATTLEAAPTDTHRTYLVPRVLPGG